MATAFAIVDPYGRLQALEVNPKGERVTLVADVSLGAGDTPLRSFGDWLGWVALAAYVAFMSFQIVTERRARGSAEDQ